MKDKPIDRDEMIARIEAGRALTQRTGMNAEKAAEMELELFMSVFHPDHSWHDKPPYRRHPHPSPTPRPRILPPPGG